MNLKNTKLVTHRGCMDGSTCAILFVAAGGLGENVIFTSPDHGNVDEVVSDLLTTWSGSIVIADVSISMKLAKEVYRSDVILLDHHKSAISLSEFPWCEIDVDNSRCGSKMLYDFLLIKVPNARHTLLEYEALTVYVDDHDRWIRQYKHSDTLSVFHNILGQEFFIDRFEKNSAPSLNSMEQYVVDLEFRKLTKYVETKKKEVHVVTKEINGHRINVGFVNAETHQSLLGHKICTDLGIDVVVLVGTTVSLRGSHTCPIDLSVVAKANSGGGHKLASGFKLSSILKDDLLELVKKNIKWK